MKKCWLGIVLATLMLAGCASEETFETVADEHIVPVSAAMREILVELPDAAASPAVESGSERLYICEDYEINVQILDGGDLNRTIQTLSGYDREALTVMEREKSSYPCYEFVWASAGEGGDQLGRAMILDDGNYHYCVSVLGDAEKAAVNRVFWDEMFQSFTLS